MQTVVLIPGGGEAVEGQKYLKELERGLTII